MKKLYFYYLTRNNEFYTEETMTNEFLESKSYYLCQNKPLPTGYYESIVPMSKIGKVFHPYTEIFYPYTDESLSIVILTENNPQQAINLFLNNKKESISFREELIFESKEEIIQLKNDIMCLEQLAIDSKIAEEPMEIERD